MFKTLAACGAFVCGVWMARKYPGHKVDGLAIQTLLVKVYKRVCPAPLECFKVVLSLCSCFGQTVLFILLIVVHSKVQQVLLPVISALYFLLGQYALYQLLFMVHGEVEQLIMALNKPTLETFITDGLMSTKYPLVPSVYHESPGPHGGRINEPAITLLLIDEG